MAIINCPYCMTKISSMAITCANCGILIKDNIRQCPHCNEWIQMDVNNCTNCMHRLETCMPNADNNRRYSSFPSTNKPSKQTSKHKGCLKKIVYLFIILILLGAGVFGIYVYKKIKIEENRTFIKELELRIAEDEKANSMRLHLAQMDSTKWNETINRKTIEAAEEYISIYPEGIFINEAYMLLEELRRRIVSEPEKRTVINVLKERLSKNTSNKGKKRSAYTYIDYKFSDNLVIKKRYVNRDSFHYVVVGNAMKVVNNPKTNTTNDADIKLHFILDSEMKIIKENIETSSSQKQQ